MARRQGHSIPKYRKHRGSGQAIVTIAGRDHYLGPHGTKASRIEYDRLITEWLVSGRPSSLPASDEISVAELIVAFWRHVQKRYVKNGKPTSEQHLFKMAVAPLRELYNETPAAEFGPLALKAVRAKMIERDFSRKTVNDNIRRVVRMFRWGAAEELIPASVPQALAMVPGLRKGSGEARETAPIMPVDDSVVDATLEHLPAIPGDMVRFQRFTGARPGEVCNLRPCDLDRSGEVWLYRPGSHKTEHHGRERTIYVGPKAQEILLRYLIRDSETCCFRPCDSEKKRLAAVNAARKTPLCCGDKPGSNRVRKPKRKPGEKYDANSYRIVVQRAAERAGVPKWAPNQLRHSAGTEVRRRFGVEGAQTILGHANVTTSQIYAEKDSALGTRIAREIG